MDKSITRLSVSKMSFYNMREQSERGECGRFGVRQGRLRAENGWEMYANSIELKKIDKTRYTR